MGYFFDIKYDKINQLKFDYSSTNLVKMKGNV